MTSALWLAAGSALCFGLALVSARAGLLGRGVRAGAAISVPTATAMLLLVAPFAVDWSAFDARAALLFAVVGLFFPAVVTLLGFRSTVEVGPTVTGAIAGTSPLFALAAAALWLGESVPAHAAWGSLGVGLGVAALSWQPGTRPRDFALRALGWAVLAAAVRGGSQALVRGGLTWWPEPVAAATIGYVMSSLVLLSAHHLSTRDLASSAPPGRRRWMVLTGLLNGAGVLFMYGALVRAPVALVAPVVASYPLVTATVAMLVPGGERPNVMRLAGVALIVAAVVLVLRAPPGA